MRSSGQDLSIKPRFLSPAQTLYDRFKVVVEPRTCRESLWLLRYAHLRPRGQLRLAEASSESIRHGVNPRQPLVVLSEF